MASAVTRPGDRQQGMEWSRREVQQALYSDYVLGDRDELVIRGADVPPGLLTRHVARVGKLRLKECTIVTDRGAAQPAADPRLHTLRLEQVNGVSKLSTSKFTTLNRLWLYDCPGMRLSDLTEQVFPALTTLELSSMSSIELNKQLPSTVQTLSLYGFDRVEWGIWQSIGCQIHHLRVRNSRLVFGDVEDDVHPWDSLQELVLKDTSIHTSLSILYESWRPRNVSWVGTLLTPRCPNARIAVDDKITHDPHAAQQRLDQDLQQAYQEACLTGTQEVYHTRLMLVDHFSAGKTSLKKTLMHQPFSSDYESTVGIETENQTCVVDVETSIEWEKGTLDNKQQFKEQVAGNVQKKLREDRAASQMPEPTEKTGVAQSAGDMGDEFEPHHSVPTKVPRLAEGTMQPELAKIIRDMQAEVLNISNTMLLQEEDAKRAVFVIWDFGGQQLYYTMHQTFLSRTALYLVVMDMSRRLDEVIEDTIQHIMWKDSGCPKTPRDFLDFWLKSIHTHLTQHGNENHSASPPVIIVCAKKDLLDEANGTRTTQIDQYIQAVRDHLKGKPYYRHVYDIIAISNCEAGDPEVDRLRGLIVDVAKKQPYWGEKRPVKWLLLAGRLSEEAASRTQEPVLKLTDVARIAETCGVTGNGLTACLSFYHKSGDIIYVDEAGTDDTVILSPQWLANMFSKVITHHYFDGMRGLNDDQKKMLKFGIMSAEVAGEFPGVTEPQTLIRIMEKFDMLVACDVIPGAPNQVYLVPCLLQRVQKYQIDQRDPQIPSIHFKCIPPTYIGDQWIENKGFLPPGLFHRLVSSCCTEGRWQHHKELIFFDHVVFDAEDFCFALHMAHDGITLSAFKFRGDPLAYSLALNELKEDLQRRIVGILDQVFPNLLCTTFLSCNCLDEVTGAGLPNEVSTSVGFIQIQCVAELERRKPCPEHRKLLDLTEYRVWFGMNSTLLDSSQMPAAGQTLLAEIKPHMTTLLTSLSYKVRDGFMKNNANLLSLDDITAIEAEKTIYAQNIKMYQILLPNVRNCDLAKCAKEAICAGLCSSSQVCPFSDERHPAPTTAQQNELRKLRPHLIDIHSSDLRELLDEVQQEDILDDHLREEIDVCKTRREQVHTLLSFISHKNSEIHERFMKILKNTVWWKYNMLGDWAVFEVPHPR